MRESPHRFVRIIRNSIFNMSGWTTTVLVQLVVLPILISRLGTEAFGVYAVLHSVLVFSTILDLGLAAGVTKFVAEHVQRRDWRRVGEYIDGATLLLVSLAFLVVLPLVTFRVSIADLLFPSSAYSDAAIRGVALVAVGIPFALASLVGMASLRGFQRFGLLNAVISVVGVLSGLGGVVAVLAGGGIVTLLSIDVAAAVLGAVVFGTMGRTQGSLDRRVHLPSSEVVRSLCAFGGYLLVFRLATQATKYVPRFVISPVLGSSAVTYFEVAFKLIVAFHGLFLQSSNVLLPVASEIFATEEKRTIRRLYLQSAQLAVWVAAPIFFVIAFHGYFLLELWVGPDMAQQAVAVLSVLALAYFVDSVTNIPALYSQGFGSTRPLALYGLANVVLVVGTIIPLLSHFGIVGAALAVLIGRFVGGFVLLLAVRSVLEVSMKDYWETAVVRPSLLSAVLVGGSWVAGSYFEIRGGWIAVTAIPALVIYSAVFWRSGVFPDNYKAMVGQVFGRHSRTQS